MKLPASFPLPIRLEWTAPRMGVFTAPFAYISPSVGRVEIETGFDTDFASVPRGLWNLYPPDGPWSPAAFIHDALYWHQALCEDGLPVTRDQADKVFLEAMTDLGIGWLTRSILYRSVRLGGGKPWAENARKKAGFPEPVAAAPAKRHFHKLIQFSMIASILALLTGCTRVPAIKAKSIHYQSSYPIGGTTIDIVNADVTDTEVKWEKYSRKSRWWYVTQDVEITGYSRERKSDEPVVNP